VKSTDWETLLCEVSPWAWWRNQYAASSSL